MTLDLARPRFQRETWLLLSSALIFGLFSRGTGMLLRSLYVVRLGYGPRMYGIWSAMGPMGFALFSLAAGWIGSRVGEKRGQMIGFGMMVLASSLMPLTEYASGPWLTILPFSSNLLAAGAWATIVVNQIPNITRVTSPKLRPEAFAWLAALTGLGSFLGSLIAGPLLDGMGALLRVDPDGRTAFAAAQWLNAALVGTGVLPVLLLPTDAPTHKTAGARAPLRGRLLVVILVICLLGQGSVAAYQMFVNPYLDVALDLSPTAVGAINSAAQIAGMFAALLSTRVTRWLGVGRDLVVTTGVAALALLPVILIRHWFAAAVSLVLVISIYYMWTSQFNGWSMAQVREDQRSSLAGLSNMAMGAAYGATALGGGFVIDALGYQPMFGLGLLLGVAGAIWFAMSLRRLPEPAEASDV